MTSGFCSQRTSEAILGQMKDPGSSERIGEDVHEINQQGRDRRLSTSPASHITAGTTSFFAMCNIRNAHWIYAFCLEERNMGWIHIQVSVYDSGVVSSMAAISHSDRTEDDMCGMMGSASTASNSLRKRYWTLPTDSTVGSRAGDAAVRSTM
ncbi:hypothetical protein AC579_1085 [Pseudocercospora musae]|uniref:Uncharacterized protein n=1 Tax=Pseudocercospora musae TaxID=113226 RepID=A0A139H876_9PEZI|nr:hypothetical protein AC579_1085 [Pseudocercospora musae]